ncbi:peptidoglycan DD-metalloendopeptidase family protein [Sulfitobacter sp. D35]|uniref:peptidoglycan DD-metalloendopeptidase family protein n=1 Tax=Sulfitobacter sp. D35 TaxID=3083252 RepID=UPI00296F72A5|nr:peptidoglycan DD-metalloendopeptidase family protein [Sulfitobacter sp. D35]MDW4496859.1 peptidoglycan DD-metalloendopeptidase family protein [Sulfitobacter sp. D35]
MTGFSIQPRRRLAPLGVVALAALTACNEPLDYDLRGLGGGFSTAEAAQVQTTARPEPDARGVISYPNYQVAVANQGDTVQSIATRLGLSSAELARFNGIEPTAPLRRGEVVALPTRVAEPPAGSPGSVDITTVAGNAINRAPATSPGVQTAALPPAQAAPAPRGAEPARHRVERGETAYSIARLYGVPVKSLAEWNGLGANLAVREGQFLLIPVAQQNPPSAPTADAVVTAPGTGSPTPTPPSAATPLPPADEAPLKTAEPAQPAKPVADVGQQSAGNNARMVFPVSGSIIREYSKGRNEGIDIKGNAGAPVKAAEGGTVAAITESADGVPIIVVRHDANLLTVYANVDGVSVKKGDSVSRGQNIAKLRPGGDAYVHFEVRKGFDSVDPLPYLQ